MNTEELIACFQHTKSVPETARQAGLSPQKVRRILLTAGEWSSPRTDEISRLIDDGESIPEIAETLGISEKAVLMHLPYQKGQYNSPNPSKNALAIRRHRERKEILP